MTTFEDGPAAGVTLSLRRAPLFLRVVRDKNGEIDALDQLDDKPRASEDVIVYQLVENRGMIHINARDKKGKHCGGYFAMATYRMVSPQPDQAIVRGPLWPSWATKAAEAKKS